MHAGATVPRAAEPFSSVGCAGGWFAIRPKGFVCATGSATTDLRHPTLAAMSIAPDLGASLPYTYARTTRDTTLFEPDPEHDDAVRPAGTLEDGSGLAVVGSWTARDAAGKPIRLGMLTDGRFVPVADLKAATPSAFAGKVLGKGDKLAVAFVVKRGVYRWGVSDGAPEKRTPIDYHARVDLSGRVTTVDGTELWEATDGGWVRLRDVTLIRERHEMPAFVTDGQRWLDVSVVTGAVVAYEGKRAVFVTVASVGRDRLGTPDGTAATQRGEFTVVAKHVTLKDHDATTFADNVALYDVPWVLELSSGQFVLGAYWHDRFGIEHGPGNIELSPADASYLFRFATPEVPTGWHAATATLSTSKPTIVNIRK
jgi:hypothetical protein